MEWTENLTAEVCSHVAARVVSLTYDGEGVVYDACAMAVRGWEAGQCGLASLLPIIYLGDPNDPNNYDPNDPNDVFCGYGCSWTWLQAETVLDILRGDGVPEALFYPGHANWAVTGQHAADDLWDPNQQAVSLWRDLAAATGAGAVCGVRQLLPIKHPPAVDR